MSELKAKLIEVLYSVLPITCIVLILHFTLTPLSTPVLWRFLIGSAVIVIGLTIFLVGVDIGITPIGNAIGSSFAKSNRLWIIIFGGIALGFFISIAEPDLHILAEQIENVTGGSVSKISIVVIVSIGIAALVAIGLARIVFNIPLYKLLIGLYAIIFILALFSSPEFIAIAFDASGATTGALTVPFLLALSTGVSMLKRDSKASEKDSFGMVGIASTGAIISVLFTSVFLKDNRMTGVLNYEEDVSTSLLSPFFRAVPEQAKDVFIALLPIILIFIVLQKISFKLSRRSVRKIMFGIIFTYIGLVMFLSGVNAGFMEVGSIIGYRLASMDNKFYVLLVGFILGLCTILAEPAVHILTHQIENVTSGYVKRSAVVVSLSIGVGAAVKLSIIRMLVPSIQLWHYLLPGYIISIVLTLIVPKLFVGIAFDSGGVASGPMTATFILAFTQGVADAAPGADVLRDGFGTIAMVAMTPLIALQVLGLVFKVKSKKEGVGNYAD